MVRNAALTASVGTPVRISTPPCDFINIHRCSPATRFLSASHQVERAIDINGAGPREIECIEKRFQHLNVLFGPVVGIHRERRRHPHSQGDSLTMEQGVVAGLDCVSKRVTEVQISANTSFTLVASTTRALSRRHCA